MWFEIFKYTIKIFIDNVEKTLKKLDLEAKFGQLRLYTKLSPYRFEFPQEEFNKVFKTEYQHLLDELKEDDELESDPPFEGAIYFPTLDQLNCLTSQLTEWMYFLKKKIFEYYFPSRNDAYKSMNYVIITWDKVELINDIFIISGQADHRYLWPQFDRTEPF